MSDMDELVKMLLGSYAIEDIQINKDNIVVYLSWYNLDFVEFKINAVITRKELKGKTDQLILKVSLLKEDEKGVVIEREQILDVVYEDLDKVIKKLHAEFEKIFDEIEELDNKYDKLRESKVNIKEIRQRSKFEKIYDKINSETTIFELVILCYLNEIKITEREARQLI